MMQTEGYVVEGEEYESILKELGVVYKGNEMEGVAVKRGRNAIDFEERAQMGEHKEKIEQAMYRLSGRRRVPQGQRVWAEEYEYDKNGNMVVQRNGWGEIEMEYNEKNEMEKRGRREYEYDANGNMRGEKMYRMRIAHGYGADNRIRYSESNRDGLYGGVSYTTDMLGSVRTTNSTGGEREEYEYTAFGDMYKGDATESYGMAYTGKQEIAGMRGVYNYGYRDYRSVEGRFMTEDPIRDGNNWHVYVSNSPMNYIDPDGLCGSLASNVVSCISPGDGGGGAVDTNSGGDSEEDTATRADAFTDTDGSMEIAQVAAAAVGATSAVVVGGVSAIGSGYVISGLIVVGVGVGLTAIAADIAWNGNIDRTNTVINNNIIPTVQGWFGRKNKSSSSSP